MIAAMDTSLTIVAWGMDFKYVVSNRRSFKGSAGMPYYLAKQARGRRPHGHRRPSNVGVGRGLQGGMRGLDARGFRV